jgi:hypothetical protein
MTTANYYVPAAPLLPDQKLRKERNRVATKQSSATQVRVETEPETRLWRICAAAAPPRLRRLEWMALSVFGASAFLAMAFCAFEWLHLYNSGSLDQIVRAILTK